MEMNSPSPRNALDENRQGLIGKPIDRVDGRLKVMGKAPYAYEVREGVGAMRPAYGFIVEATIAKGSVAEIDASAAEKAPGVLLVYTHKNAPKQGAWGPLDAKDRYSRSSPQMGSNRVEYYGQAVAFVVAQTFEQARSAARLVSIRYAAAAGEFELKSKLALAEKPPDEPTQQTDSAVGDFAGGRVRGLGGQDRCELHHAVSHPRADRAARDYGVLEGWASAHSLRSTAARKCPKGCGRHPADRA